MSIDITFARDDAQRRHAYRLRYEQYCEAQGLLRERADHDARLLVEDEDERAHLLVAYDDSELMGTLRLQWGGDGDVGPEMKATFISNTFAADVAPTKLAIGSRFVIHPRARGSTLMVRMMQACVTFCLERDVELLFGDCEPHLLHIYRSFGFRPYRDLVNHETSGVLVPLVLTIHDLEHLTHTRSPLRKLVHEAQELEAARSHIHGSLIPPTRAARNADPRRDDGDSTGVMKRFVDSELPRPDLFADLDPDQIERVLARTNVLTCKAGDALIREGHRSRTLYLVLEGTLVIRRGEQLLAVATRGDVVGEIAFLLGEPRTADVWAAHDGVRVLALSEAELSKLLARDPKLAGTLLLNLAKAVCYKLAYASGAFDR